MPFYRSVNARSVVSLPAARARRWISELWRRIGIVVPSSSSMVLLPGQIFCTNLSKESGLKIIEAANNSHTKNLTPTLQVPSCTARLIVPRSFNRCSFAFHISGRESYRIFLIKDIWRTSLHTTLGSSPVLRSIKSLLTLSARSPRWHRLYNFDFDLGKWCQVVYDLYS